MKKLSLCILSAAFVLLQGCSFSMPYSSTPAPSYDEATYSDTKEPVQTKTATIKHEDEIPVQMTKQDSDLDAVAPVAKNPAKADQDKNVLLPISSGDLE